MRNLNRDLKPDPALMSIIEAIIVMIVMLGLFMPGCSIFGGNESDPYAKPISKLETDLKTAKKEIDKSKKQLENITGDVSMFEQRFSKIENIMTNIQTQVSVVKSEANQYNESITRILWTLGGLYILFHIFKFISIIVAAKFAPGSTVKNVFTLPWEKRNG